MHTYMDVLKKLASIKVLTGYGTVQLNKQARQLKELSMLMKNKKPNGGAKKSLFQDKILASNDMKKFDKHLSKDDHAAAERAEYSGIEDASLSYHNKFKL